MPQWKKRRIRLAANKPIAHAEKRPTFGTQHSREYSQYKWERYRLIRNTLRRLNGITEQIRKLRQ